MNIKKIFINCMLILCIGVIVLSVVTVVKRGNEPADNVVFSQDVKENETIVLDAETVESTEEVVEEETIATKTLYTVSKVNVRRGPGTNYQKVVQLKARVAVIAIGDLDENGWQKIEYEGEEAYILGRYLTETVLEEQSQSVGNQTMVVPQTQNTQQQAEVVQTPPAEQEVVPIE